MPDSGLLAEREPGRIVAFYAGKGGVGRTTLAINVACLLATEHKRRVVLVDFDLQFGDVGTIVDAPSQRGSILDLATVALEDLDLELARTAVTPGPAGVMLLTCPPRPELADLVEMRRDNVEKVIQLLRLEYDQVLVDAGRFLGEAGAIVVDMADRIILVTSATALSMKSTRQVLALFEMLAVQGEKVSLVLNHVDEHHNFGESEVEENLGHAVAVSIPHDSRTAVTAIDSGEPFALAKPRIPLTNAVRKLTELVLRTPERPRSAVHKGSVDDLMAELGGRGA